jgi:aryl-alcohol dehydrogenase-like predicted oxidoreductase
VQNRYNLLDRSGVQVLADCEAQGITFVPYFPLASGQLTTYDELTGPAQRLGATPDLRANTAAAEVASHLTDAEVARLTSLADESTAVLSRRPAKT